MVTEKKSWVVWHKPDPKSDQVVKEVYYEMQGPNGAFTRYSALEQKYCPKDQRSSMRVGMYRLT